MVAGPRALASRSGSVFDGLFLYTYYYGLGLLGRTCWGTQLYLSYYLKAVCHWQLA